MIYKSFAETIPEAVAYLQSPIIGPRLPLWKTFDHYLGGMRPNELTLLCAPTGAGKTALLANVSSQLVAQSIPHFVAPVETGYVDYTLRVASALLQEDLNTGDKVSPEKCAVIIKQLKPAIDLERLYVSPHENRVSVDEMIATLTYMYDHKKCEVALLDNLNFFLDVTSTNMEKAVMDDAIHEFVMLAKRIPMHIVLVVHPRKTMDGRVESEFDIKGSSTAVQEAANVILFNRPKKEDVDRGNKTWFDREIVFRKLRKRGAYVNKPVWLTYRTGRYLEYV